MEIEIFQKNSVLENSTAWTSSQKVNRKIGFSSIFPLKMRHVIKMSCLLCTSTKKALYWNRQNSLFCAKTYFELWYKKRFFNLLVIFFMTNLADHHTCSEFWHSVNLWYLTTIFNNFLLFCTLTKFTLFSKIKNLVYPYLFKIQIL